jgi:hypothetical protein
MKRSFHREGTALEKALKPERFFLHYEELGVCRRDWDADRGGRDRAYMFALFHYLLMQFLCSDALPYSDHDIGFKNENTNVSARDPLFI